MRNVQPDQHGYLSLDSIHPAVWEDITDQTKLGELQNGCVTFSSKVSARFWLVHSPKPRSTPELLKIAHAVYNEGIKIPYMAKFVVFAKRHADNEARLRLFCVTDDKHENVMAGTTLESQENFTQIAKSRDVEVCTFEIITLVDLLSTKSVLGLNRTF